MANEPSISDFLPIPHTTSPVTDPDKVEVANSLAEKPTTSHALAMAEHDEKGHAQMDHDAGEVKDLGWTEHVDQIPKPLVGGLPNEELWVLVRRFNKVSCVNILSSCGNVVFELKKLALESRHELGGDEIAL